MSEKWKAADIPSLAGKRVLITGANSGIGYHTALKLARKGAHVMLGCRDRQRGEEALARLDADSPSAHTELVIFDLASLASVRAAHFGPRIHLALPLQKMMGHCSSGVCQDITLVSAGNARTGLLELGPICAFALGIIGSGTRTPIRRSSASIQLSTGDSASIDGSRQNRIRREGLGDRLVDLQRIHNAALMTDDPGMHHGLDRIDDLLLGHCISVLAVFDLHQDLQVARRTSARE